MFVAFLCLGFENVPASMCFYDVNKPVTMYKKLPK